MASEGKALIHNSGFPFAVLAAHNCTPSFTHVTKTLAITPLSYRRRQVCQFSLYGVSCDVFHTSVSPLSHGFRTQEWTPYLTTFVLVTNLIILHKLLPFVYPLPKNHLSRRKKSITCEVLLLSPAPSLTPLQFAHSVEVQQYSSEKPSRDVLRRAQEKAKC